jgi:hypothetical protein
MRIAAPFVLVLMLSTLGAFAAGPRDQKDATVLSELPSDKNTVTVNLGPKTLRLTGRGSGAITEGN